MDTTRLIEESGGEISTFEGLLARWPKEMARLVAAIL